jgi:hypothetical protein
MPMKRSLALLALILALIPSLGAQTWDAALPATLDKMAENYYQPSVQTVFGTFTFAYSSLPSPFSRWLEDGLASAMTRSSRLKLINSKAAAAMDPAFAKVYGDFFAQADGGALLYGTYFDEGDNVRVRLELTGFSDRTLIGVNEFRVPKKALPQGLAVDPSKAIVQAANDLGNLLPAHGPGGLMVSLATDRGPGAAYYEGEVLSILVTVNKDAWIKAYQIDVAGKVQLIYPNRFERGGMARAGEILKIPGPDAPFTFDMIPPFGTEFLKVIASTTPFAEDEEDFQELGKDVRGVITRGLAIKPNAGAGKVVPERAEALASYVIMPKRR